MERFPWNGIPSVSCVVKYLSRDKIKDRNSWGSSVFNYLKFLPIDITYRVVRLKPCLMRDKVDLLGKPVIAMAINLMMRFNYISRSDDIIEFYSHDTKERIKFNLGDSPPGDNDLGYWSVLYERL